MCKLCLPLPKNKGRKGREGWEKEKEKSVMRGNKNTYWKDVPIHGDAMLSRAEERVNGATKQQRDQHYRSNRTYAHSALSLKQREQTDLAGVRTWGKLVRTPTGCQSSATGRGRRAELRSIRGRAQKSDAYHQYGCACMRNGS